MGLRLAVAPLQHVFESLSADVSKCYEDLDHNPAELRFFTMAATSVFLQTFGDLSREKMQALVGMFYEQSAANLLLYMPRAEFSMIHTAASQRFPIYADLIIDVINADTVDDQESANISLVSTLDQNTGVERGAFDRSLAALTISAALVDHAVQVKDAVEEVRGTF
jgi:hypothetical protein